MECRIAGVVPVVNKWSDECCITVRQMLTGKAVTVKLLEATEKEGVHAVDIVLSMSGCHGGESNASFIFAEGKIL